MHLTNKKVLVCGHKGMVGSAVLRRLDAESCKTIVADRKQLDLTDQKRVFMWLESNRPQVVVLAAAKVGGIHANNTEPASFLYENLVIESNVIHGAYKFGIEKLIFLGSSCIYPRVAPQPLVPSSLLSGELEPTNEWYAIAKIAGIKLCQAYRKQYGCNYISAMPTNLYGPGDSYSYSKSHVIPALIKKIHEAKVNKSRVVEVWGTGSPLREFLHVDDLADAVIFLLKNYSGYDPINVGAGIDISIRDLAYCIRDVIGFEGELEFNTSMPDGTPRKLLDVSIINSMGWQAQTSLKEGLLKTYQSFLEGHYRCNLDE